MLELAQMTVDTVSWFLMPFAVMLGVTWVVSLFNNWRQ